MQPFRQFHRFYRLMGAGLILLLSMGLLSCHEKKPLPPSESQVTQINYQKQLVDFSEPNLALLADKLRHSHSQTLHIVQLGDSHTAADFFTGKLRDLFQQRYGDAGPGFVSPMTIPGQRNARVKFSGDKTGWWLSSSRKEDRADFPLGGFIAMPERAGSTITMNLSPSDNHKYRMRVLYQSHDETYLKPQSSLLWRLPATQSEWRFSPDNPVFFPLKLSAHDAQLKIGGWLISRQNSGVLLSALGINGATINMLNKWQPEWINTLAQVKPDLVILAYGTNEAFNDALDLDGYRQELIAKIQKIRSVIPDAVILLIGPNDSLKNKHAIGCEEQQPALLRDVIRIQQEVASKQHTLFWNWQAFMGGTCSIRIWEQQGLARPDYIHLSAAGYERSAEGLYKQFIDLIGE
ncbi:SGNH/GDSL hydrolase family protein [Xenorhabdus sp. KJ12.1]|uniref:SGNH/GDSL hydrolase family protein n=1 Tax=Xenorhabdus sp. KJ12.1 TaxID=1851571 RepID=UPI000C049200|nr:SGNH/GDSL hydrolase family protein [Xenorhabdus sp. KJ12.1]